GCRLTLLDESTVLELGVRAPQLVLRVHDDGAVPRHRLLDRLPRHEQEPDTGVACLDRHRLPTVEQHERPVLHFPGRAAPAARAGYHRSHPFRLDGTRLRGVTEGAAALEHV